LAYYCAPIPWFPQVLRTSWFERLIDRDGFLVLVEVPAWIDFELFQPELCWEAELDSEPLPVARKPQG